MLIAERGLAVNHYSMVYKHRCIVLSGAFMKNSKRVYHRGRKRPSEIAKLAWAELRRPEYTPLLAAHLDLSKAAISKWKQVPEDRLEAVAELLRIPRSALRPDLPDIHTTASVDDLYARSQPKENT